MENLTTNEIEKILRENFGDDAVIMENLGEVTQLLQNGQDPAPGSALLQPFDYEEEPTYETFLSSYEGGNSCIGAVGKVAAHSIGLVLEVAGFPKIHRIDSVAMIILRKVSVPAIRALGEKFYNATTADEKAGILFQLIKMIFEGVSVKELLKAAYKGMSWWDIAKMVVKLAAWVTASVFSGGVALVARIVALIPSAVDLALAIKEMVEECS